MLCSTGNEYDCILVNILTVCMQLLMLIHTTNGNKQNGLTIRMSQRIHIRTFMLPDKNAQLLG